MFEDSMFESAGKIKTKSKYWMIATAILNASVVITLVLIPLIYPEALPTRHWRPCWWHRRRHRHHHHRRRLR